MNSPPKYELDSVYYLRMKNIILIVIILVVIAVLVQFVVKSPKSDPAITDNATEQVIPPGDTTGVNPATTNPNSQSQSMTTPPSDAQKVEMTTTASGLKYGIVTPGTGKEAKSGDLVTVHYTGTLTDGRKFDSSVDRGQPAQFPIGVGQLIKGWDEGIPGMKVGEKRILVVPGDLAYGSNPPPGSIITPNATLVFEVELIDTTSAR